MEATGDGAAGAGAGASAGGLNTAGPELDDLGGAALPDEGAAAESANLTERGDCDQQARGREDCLLGTAVEIASRSRAGRGEARQGSAHRW